MPERYTPVAWAHNKFSAEAWLQRALRHHPNRVSNPAEADYVFLAANFSMMCRAGKSFTARFLWQKMVSLPIFLNTSVPKVVALTDTECPADSLTVRARWA